MEKIEENGITYVTGASTGDSGFDWQKSSNYFCANGLEITISAWEGGCTVSWISDDGVERSKDLPADVTICGGSWDGEVSSSKITMTGGTVNGGLFGGGVTADSKVTGNVEINVLGGTLYNGVVGGGICGSVGGNVAIEIGNAEGGPYIQDNVIGGGFMDSADVAGNVTVSINNGQIGTGSSSNTAIVTGGGVFGDVSGKVTVNVADGDVYAIVSGGSMISGDVNQSEINVSGGTVRCVSGGSIDYLMNGDAGSVKNVVINITDGEITNSVYGGSIRRGDIEESAVVNISGGTIGTDGEAEVIVAGSQIGDITGSATVNISNEGEAAPQINGAIKGADSILLNNEPVSLAVIYVDASATTSDIANGKIVGVNVFDSFITALKNVNADTTEIKISGDLTESATNENVAVVLSKDLTISGNVKWDSGRGWIQFKKANGVDSVNLNFADFELSGAASNTKVFYFSDGVTATVDKDSSLEFYNGAIQPGATVKVENGGKFICLKEALQVQANGDKRATFIVEGEDTVAYTKYVNVDADANVTDSKFSANDYINVRNAGVFTADNSVVEIGTNESGVWIGNPVPNGVGQLKVSGTDSVFNLTNGSTLKVSGNITNNGTINIEDSTFLANGTLVSDGVVLEAYNKGVVTNNGTINVSGESTLTIRELAGSEDGRLVVKDGTVLTDSSITGTGIVKFESGTTTFKGENVITSALDNSVENFDLVVEKDASLLISRYTLGYGRDITVNGSIEDATSLESLEGITLSLKVNHANGFSIGGFGTSVLKVNDAYVDLGKSTWKNATGTYTWDFSNSYVKVGSFADNKSGASDTAAWVTTFDDSVLASDTYLKNGKGMTINFKNGSIANIKGSMRIDGVLNIDAASVVNIEGYFNAGEAMAVSEHSDILGEINVSGNMNVKGSGTTNIELLENGKINIDGGSVDLTNNNSTVNNIIVTENAGLNINNGSLVVGTVTNAGSVVISGDSEINGAITNNGSVKLVGETTVDLNVSGNAVEIAADLTDTKINNSAFVTGDSSVSGTTSISGVTKVVNGATLTFAEGVNFTGANLAAGNDFYFGFGEDETYAKGGTIDIYGNVKVNQTNADGDGIVNVKEGAVLNTAEFCVENGEMEDASSGVVNVEGSVKTASLRIFNGGTVNVSGTIEADHADDVASQLDINIWGDGVLNVNGGTVNVAESMAVAENAALNINGGSFSVDKTLINNGTASVTGESTLNINALTGNAIEVFDGASLTDSVIGGAVNLVSGESNWSGKNTVTGIFSAGYYNYEEGDIETAITGEFTNSNFLTWNTEGSKTVVNIGDADGDRTAFNGGQIGIFERSEINIANADVTYNYAFIRSDFNVSDSTLTITGVNTYFSGAADVTVENSTWTTGAYSCLGSYGAETAVGSAVVTLLGNSTMNADNLKLSATEGTDHNVSLNVEDATVNISSSLTVGAGAEVTLTEKSLINATGAAVTNNGSFAVNVTDGWSGIKTVIDGKAGTDSFGNVVIDSADAANGVKSYVDAEKGDLIIYNIKYETVYVDSAWTGYSFGDEIAEGKYYGINAYDSLLGYKAAAETKTLEIAGGTYESVFNTTTDVSVMNGGINTVNASGEVVVSVGSLVFETEVKGDVYINGAFTTTDANTWNYEQNMMPYYNGTIQFKGGKDTTFNIDGTFNAAEGFTFDAGKTIISEDSVLTINDQHCGQFNIYGEVTNYGQMTVDLQVGSTLRLVNIGNGGSLILSGEKASLTTNIVNDQPWAGAQCVDFYIKNGSLTVEDGAKVSATGIVEVYSDGSINVSDAEFSAAAVTNNGTVTVSGASTLNGAFTGNALSVESGTVLSGSLEADLVLKGNVTVTADFDGTILGNKKVYITEDNKFNLSADGNKIAGIIVSDGIVFGEGENLGSVAIEGADKNAVITIADSALNGNKFSKGKLVIINDEDDNFIAVNTDLSLIKAIREGDDEFAVESVSGLYYYINGEGVTQILSKTDRGIKISNSSDDNGGNTEVAVDNVKKFDIKKDSTALANVNVEMAEGISTIKLSNGSTTKDGAVDLMKFSIGAVSKDKNGGKNNFTFGNYNDVKINGDIEALGSLTLGNDSFLKVEGDVSGNNKSQNIKIGSNSNAKFGDIKFDVHGCPGDKDSFSIAGSSVVTTGTLTGLEVLKLDNGTEDKQTEMIVDGDIVAPMVNSTITLGKYAKLEIKGKVDNGDVACVTGTTFKIADNSGVSITDAVTGMAGLTLGNNSMFTAADISGTEKTNKVVLGKDAEMYAGAIDLKTGKNSIKLSDGAYLGADSVSNVQSITVGSNGAVLDISNAINDVQKLTVGKDSRLLASEINGTDDNDTWKIGDASEIGLNGSSVDLNFGAGKDSVKIGKNVEAYFADVDFGAGNDSLMIGAESVVFFDTLDMGEGSKDVVKLDKNSKTYVRELENVNELSASAGAELWFSEGGCGADALSEIGGSWNNATIYDEIGSLDFNAAMSGQVFANEWDVYHFDSVNDGTLTLEATENVKLQYSFNGSDWFVYDGSLAYDGGSNLSVRVAVDDEFNKKDIADKKGYSFTATIA